MHGSPTRRQLEENGRHARAAIQQCAQQEMGIKACNRVCHPCNIPPEERRRGGGSNRQRSTAYARGPAVYSKGGSRKRAHYISRPVGAGKAGQDALQHPKHRVHPTKASGSTCGAPARRRQREAAQHGGRARAGRLQEGGLGGRAHCVAGQVRQRTRCAQLSRCRRRHGRRAAAQRCRACHAHITSKFADYHITIKMR